MRDLIYIEILGGTVAPAGPNQDPPLAAGEHNKSITSFSLWNKSLFEAVAD